MVVTNFSTASSATKDFMMSRIHNLMEQSDQSDAQKVMHQRFQGGTKRTTSAARAATTPSSFSSSAS